MVFVPVGAPPGSGSGTQSDIDGQSGGKISEVKTVVCGGTSALLLPERPKRNFAIINAPTELGLPVYVVLGDNAATTNCSVKLYPGDTLVLEAEPYWRRCEWTGRVAAITDGAAVALNVTEVYFA